MSVHRALPLLFAILLTACSSSNGMPPASCNTCDGNVAVQCEVTCNDELVGTPTRVSCGSKKCTSSTSDRECTSQGTAWTGSQTDVGCE